MRKLLILFAVLALVACGSGVANAVVVIGDFVGNGNLDQTYPQPIVDNNPPPGLGPEDFSLAKPLIWVNEGTRTNTGPYEDELSSEGFAGGAPTPATADGTGTGHPTGCGSVDCGVFFKPFSGDLATGNLATGHLYQDNPGIPGLKYIMSGWAGAEPSYSGLIPGGVTKSEFAIEFDTDNDRTNGFISSVILDLVADGMTGDTGANGRDYELHTLMGVAPPLTTVVRVRVSMIDAYGFNNGNPAPGQNGQAFVVDDFTLTAIPEPASVALGLIGILGMLGLVRRR